MSNLGPAEQTAPQCGLRTGLRWPVCSAALVGVILAISTFGPVLADPPVAAAASQPPESGMVQLNFPDEIELNMLVDYVSHRLGVKILYDEQIANKRIKLKSPGQIPADSLLGLLESALKMKSLALVDADIAGWKQIRATTDLSQIAQPRGNEPLEAFGNTTAVTQVFELRHVDPERLSQIIKPFMTQPGANTISVPDQRLLIVTDYADNIQKISRLVEVVDRSGPATSLEFYTAQHVEASQLAQQIAQTIASQNAGKPQGAARAEVSHDPRTNQLLIVGTAEQVQQILSLVRALDVPLGLSTEVYTFRYVDAARVDQLVQELVDPLTVKRFYRSAVDETDNMLVVSATAQIHERIRWLRDQLDLETKRPGSAVRFYRLKHASATEVMATIQAIEQTQGESRLDHLRGVSALGRGGVAAGNSLGSGLTPAIADKLGPVPNLVNPPSQPAAGDPASAPPNPDALPSTSGATAAPPVSIVSATARVTVDQATNTIIVVADHSTQQMYEELIQYLDQRPRQVMIEAKVVVIDTSNNFALGIDLAAPHCDSIGRVLTFTQFGIGAVDPVSGAMSLAPGSGLNAALVNPEEGEAILRAISKHKRARVVSAPRVLVNDNETGTLASVQEVPFTSVNASNTVATTSFAGFAEAGTSIEVTPRISDDDDLQMEYVISLNNFTGSGGAGVPPPRQTDEVTSTVTIPDGYTVIVGGLNRQNFAEEFEGIPYIEDIPVVGHLLGSKSRANSQTTLFVFLRPVILRDDKFRDLKFLSDRDLADSCAVGNFPLSGPLLVD